MWEQLFKNSNDYYVIRNLKTNEIETNLPIEYDNKPYLNFDNIRIINDNHYVVNNKLITINDINYQIITFNKMPENILKLGIKDSKTPTYNFTYFKSLVEFSLKENNSLIMVVFDIDNFKSINDTYGHSYGDDVLLTVTELIQYNIHKKNDYICRFGGDEFIICFTNVDKEQVIERLNNINKRLETGLYIKNNICQITLSMGIIIYNKDKSFEENFEEADKALYESKEDGKNRITDFSQILSRKRKTNDQ
jgi:diguanylate cyclase (GGDEF)-like protein